MNIAILKAVVADWLDPSALPPLTRRDVERRTFEGMRNVLAIVGPRRAGKTFLMFQYIEDLLAAGHSRDDILFIDFEDYRLRDFRPDDTDSLLAAFEQLTGKPPRFLFFDEVQRLPSWSRVIRTLHNRRKHVIVVSGSNSELLTQEVSTELHGRYEDQLVMPFSIAERLRHADVTWTKTTLHTAGRGRLMKVFDDYLLWGGYPEVIERATPQQKRQLLQRYVDTIFFKDICDRHGIRARSLLEAMMARCLSTYAGLFSISAFEKSARDRFGVSSKRTIANYLKHMEDAFFIVANEKFSFSPRKRLMNPRKTYLVDNGLRSLGLEFSENRGRALENAVAVDLERRRLDQFYARDRYECDFVVLEDRQPSLAIQVAWQFDSHDRERELRGLIEAMDAFNIRNGLILTYADEGRETYRGRAFAVTPAWKWMLRP